MQSAADVRGEYDLTDVPSIVAGSIRLGLFESVIVLLFSLEFILINLIVDVLYGLINPVIRYR